MDRTRYTRDGGNHAQVADPWADTIQSSLKIGAASGATGFVIGGLAGIIRGVPPALFATTSAVQTFALGTTFWGCRAGVLHAWSPAHQTPSDLTKASGISGGITGAAVALITRGRSNAIPGAIMMSVFGVLGQTAYNRFYAPVDIIKDQEKEQKPSFWRRMSMKSFSPVTVLSNEEYAGILQEKMLKLDAEIALIDDKIAALRDEQQQQQQKPSAFGVDRPDNVER